jgi:peptidoglycan/LPS O-acetylase OafA/YrhL
VGKQAIKPGASRFNSFDGLRLVGASAVLVSHAFPLTARHEPTFGRSTLGTLGVYLFFAISGFLITQSWVREPDLRLYLAKRALRILPALIAVLVLTAFVLGPLVTTLPVGDYLSSAGPWKFVFRNIIMLPGSGLPGVFKGNPYPNAVNGSLWTLTNEVHAYLIVALIGLAGLYRRRLLALVALVGVVALSKHYGNAGGHGIVEPRLMIEFACGSALYLWRERIPWRAPVAVALVLVSLATPGSDLGFAALLLTIPYLAIYLAYRLPTAGRWITRHGDFSYGLYLWAFTLQQLLTYWWPTITPWESIPLVAAGATCAAIASWHLVERPSLALKARLTRGPVHQGPLDAVDGPAWHDSLAPEVL